VDGALLHRVSYTRQRHLSGVEAIPTSAGSNAEFYIEPMFSCASDFDIMFHRSDQLAIPAEYPLPAELPAEFHSVVQVYQIINTEFPGYVRLKSYHLLAENADDGKYGALQNQQQFISHSDFNGMMYELDGGDVPIRYCNSHGPAFISEWFNPKKTTDILCTSRRIPFQLRPYSVCAMCIVASTSH